MEREIQKVITAVPVPENSELRFDKPKVRLMGAYAVQQNGWNEYSTPGVVFVMGATGNIAVRIKKL